MYISHITLCPCTFLWNTLLFFISHVCKTHDFHNRWMQIFVSIHFDHSFNSFRSFSQFISFQFMSIIHSFQFIHFIHFIQVIQFISFNSFILFTSGEYLYTCATAVYLSMSQLDFTI